MKNGFMKPKFHNYQLFSRFCLFTSGFQRFWRVFMILGQLSRMPDILRSCLRTPFGPEAKNSNFLYISNRKTWFSRVLGSYFLFSRCKWYGRPPIPTKYACPYACSCWSIQIRSGYRLLDIRWRPRGTSQPVQYSEIITIYSTFFGTHLPVHSVLYSYEAENWEG